ARDEQAELLRMVEAGAWTRLEMARRLGLSERTLYRRLKALGRA
ncbi:MAG: hypothetical protein KGL18_19530, partial [Burkholderiales bacterium]|nr:hypothetical protein [Burkholderiales bacterium]